MLLDWIFVNFVTDFGEGLMYCRGRNCCSGSLFEIEEDFSGFRKGKPRVTGGHKATGPLLPAIAKAGRTAGLPKKRSLSDSYLIRVKACFLFGEQAFFWEVNKE
jgi:hypothetical protein